jgi:hypothetical protein
MKRSFLGLLAAATVLPTSLAAQYRGPRSADYLFGASIWGSRALWVNPAGQGIVDEASLMLEGVVERDPAGNYPLSQYSIGFNSRGFAFGFRRDFFRVDVGLGTDSLVKTAGNTWRVGFGRGLGSLAIGAAVSLYSGSQTKQDLDIGLRYRVTRGLDVALGFEHIGQPTVRDSSLRFTTGASLAWTTLNGVLGIDLEARGSNGYEDLGVVMGYRGGLRLQIPTRIPVALNGALELDDGFDIGRLLVALSIGGDVHGVMVGGGQRLDDTNYLTTASVLGEARTHFR